MPIDTTGSVGYVSIGEIFDSSTGKPFSHDNKREHVKQFLVVIDRRDWANDIRICLHPALPQPYSVYISQFGDLIDNEALLVDMSAKLLNGDNWAEWIVTCRYSTDLGNRPKRDKKSDNQPELEPPTLHWETETIQKTLPFSLDGVAFLNSANCPYKPAPTVEMVRPVLVFARNQLKFGLTDIEKWGFVCNDSLFLGRIAGQARSNPPTAEAMYKGGVSYFKVTTRIVFGAKFPIAQKMNIRQIDENAAVPGTFEIIKEQQTYEWLDVTDILDEGYMELEQEIDNPNAGKPVAIFRNGRAVTTPQLLDGRGKNNTPAPGDPPNPFFNRFTICASDDLNQLIRQGVPVEQLILP